MNADLFFYHSIRWLKRKFHTDFVPLKNRQRKEGRLKFVHRAQKLLQGKQQAAACHVNHQPIHHPEAHTVPSISIREKEA